MSDPAAPEAPVDVGAEKLAELLDQLGSVLLSTETIGTTIELVTLLASETITATAGAGLTLVDGRGRRITCPDEGRGAPRPSERSRPAGPWRNSRSSS